MLSSYIYIYRPSLRFYKWLQILNYGILGFFVNANAIVEFEEWSIASIIRVGRSRRGVKTLLWITEYITKSFVIHYEGFELSHC